MSARLVQLSGVVVDITYRVQALPAPGHEAIVTGFSISAGGGFNAMVAARRMGLHTAYGGTPGTAPSPTSPVPPWPLPASPSCAPAWPATIRASARSLSNPVANAASSPPKAPTASSPTKTSTASPFAPATGCCCRAIRWPTAAAATH